MATSGFSDNGNYWLDSDSAVASQNWLIPVGDILHEFQRDLLNQELRSLQNNSLRVLESLGPVVQTIGAHLSTSISFDGGLDKPQPGLIANRMQITLLV